jgi:hypothetical protein
MKGLHKELQQDLNACFRSFIRETKSALPKHSYLIIVPTLCITSYGGIEFTAKILPYSSMRTEQKMFKKNYDMPSFDTLKMLFTEACTIPIDVVIPDWEDILDTELYDVFIY